MGVVGRWLVGYRPSPLSSIGVCVCVCVCVRVWARSFDGSLVMARVVNIFCEYRLSFFCGVNVSTLRFARFFLLVYFVGVGAHVVQ